jgi:uncharacterized protein (TIGR03083 family)
MHHLWHLCNLWMIALQGEASMDEPMTKSRLLEILQAKRAELDALLAQVPRERMAIPGAAGHWSVKDIIAHLTYYERWLADRLHEQLRGESYTPTELDFMGDARNDVFYEQARDKPLDQVLADSRQAFQDLLTGVDAHNQAFLIEPQQFEGAPAPMIVWHLLRGDVYEHYAMHMPSIEQWIAAAKSKNQIPPEFTDAA